MKNPFRILLKTARKARARPISAALALQKLALATIVPPKRPKSPRPATKRKPATGPKRPPRPVPGSFSDGTFGNVHGRLAFKLYTPQGSARRKLPLFVMLHGCSQSAADFAAGTRMNALADEFGFLVIYPEQSRLANIGRCWNWHRPGDRMRGRGEPALIAGLVRHVITTSKANAARVYIAGISAGGAAAAIIGAAYPDVFVAVGVHSGLVADKVGTLREAMVAMRTGPAGAAAGKGARPLPAIIFHGDQDRLVHPANAGGFLDMLRRSGSGAIESTAEHGRSRGGRDFTTTSHRLGRGPVILEEWIIHGGGHAWSGGSTAGSFTDPAGPDASREMVRFFLAHRRGPLRTRSKELLA